MTRERLSEANKSKQSRYMPQFPLSGELLRITGVDLTQIDGMNVMTAQTLISEIGLDMSRWKNGGALRILAGTLPGQPH